MTLPKIDTAENQSKSGKTFNRLLSAKKRKRIHLGVFHIVLSP